MKILVIGGTGMIGTAVVNLLKKEHEVISIGKISGDYQMDINNNSSIEKLFKDFKDIDGVISTTGDGVMGTFNTQPDEEIDLAINSKLKANINLIRTAINYINENGFIIVTTGAASHTPIPGASSITMATAGLEGYVRAIQVEERNNIRVNVVSPQAVIETLTELNMSFPNAVSVADTAMAYKKVIDSNESGIIANIPEYLEQ